MGEAEFLEQFADVAFMVFDAEALGDDRLRSMRRQRTTPSISRSGPASTIVANSAIWAAFSRDGLGLAPR